MNRNYPIKWRSSIALLTAAGFLIATVPICGAVPPASGTGFGGSSSSSGGAFSGGRTPGVNASSGSFNFVPPAATSMPASGAPPGTGNVSFPSGSNITQANNGAAGTSGQPRLMFQGQGSALGTFGSSFPGQAGVGGDFRGPAGAAGGVVGGSTSSPTMPQPNSQPASNGLTSNGAPSGAPASNLVVGNNSNPLLVGSPATSPGLMQMPAGATATAATQTYDWRYVNYNGMQWYWTPNNTWLYYQNGAWQPFTQTSTGQASTGSQSAGQTPYIAGAGGSSAAGTVVR